MMARRTMAAAGLVLAGLGPARAEGLADWDISRPQIGLGDGWTAHLGGDLNLTGYTARQDGGIDRTSATASAFAYPSLDKLFANGWRVGFKSMLNLYHDVLSGDNYGNDVFAKAYFFVDAPWGEVELGQQDGAAYKMAVTGPVVAGAVAIDDSNIGFFKDPATGGALNDAFNVRSGVFATRNAAKISYYAPRLLGVRVGVSYTPELTKGVIPFADHAPRVADRQDDVIEGAINYTGYFGATSLGAYAGVAAGHNAQRTPGHDDLLDWGLGAEIDYDFGGPVLAVGGAYRQSNGYALDPARAWASGTTDVVHATTRLSKDDWQIGFEYSRGAADAEVAMPALAITGYQADIGYSLTRNLQLTAGWQHQRYTRSSGVFYNGRPVLDADAGFLYFNFHV